MSVINGYDVKECPICHQDNWTTMTLSAEVEGHACMASIEAEIDIYKNGKNRTISPYFLLCKSCGFMRLMIEMT